MPRLPGISQKDAGRVFQKLGYRIVREFGHLILSNGECRLVVPTVPRAARKRHMRLGQLWQQPSLTQVAPCITVS